MKRLMSAWILNVEATPRQKILGYAVPIIEIMVASLLVFSVLEWLERFLKLDLLRWQVDSISVFVGTAIVGVVTFMALRKIAVLHQRVLEQNATLQKSEQELVRTKEWFRFLADHSTDLLILVDARGTILYESPSVDWMLGYSPNDRVGQNTFSLVHPDDAQHAKDVVAQAFQNFGRVYTATMRVKKANGQWCTLEVNGRSVMNNDGKRLGLMNARDVTERHQAQEALRQQEERFRSLTENIQDIISVLQPDGIITYESPSIKSVLGYEPEELVGKNALAFIHEEDRLRIMQTLQNLLGDPGKTASEEFRFQARDGTWRYLGSVGKSLVDHSGKVILVVTSRDITASKNFENNLRLQTAALTSAANGIVITERDGTIIWTNPAFTRLTGYDALEVLGQTPRVLKSGIQDTAFYADLWSAITSGRSWHGELINKRKNGSIYTEEQTITPVYNEKGGITHFIAIKQDISERKAMERYARQTERLAMLGQLLGSVAHEIKNPLFIVKGRLQLLKESLNGGNYESAKHDLPIIEDAANRITAITHKFLNLAKPVEAQWKDCSVHDVLAETMTFLSHELKKNHIRIVQKLAPDLPKTWTEPHQLQEVFLDLMMNAMQAMVSAHGQGTMTISTGREDDWIVVRIKDDGPGIKSEHRNKLFEPFFTTKNGDEGTGLGLWNVRTILTTLHGSAGYEAGDDPGATFVMRIPVIPSPVNETSLQLTN